MLKVTHKCIIVIYDGIELLLAKGGKDKYNMIIPVCTIFAFLLIIIGYL